MTGKLRTSVVYTAMILLTALAVNLLSSPGFLWFVFPAFGVLWWPLSVYFADKKQPLRYGICGASLLAAMLLVTYLLTSPGAHPWFLYPILAVLWWPLSVWGAQNGARKFSAAGGLYVILTLLIVNLVTSPGFWWWVYPAFFVLWWPVSVHLGEKAKTMSFAVCSAIAAFLFTVVMHRIHSPHAEPWYLYTLLPFAWWPVSKYLSTRVSGTRIALITAIVFPAYYMGLTALLHAATSLLSLFALAAAAWLVYALGISKHRDSSGFAALNAILLAGYFILVHRLFTAGAHAWYWYTFFPLAWWVFAAAMRENAFKPRNVLLGALAALLYYGALNRWLSPAVPWILFLTGPAVVAVLCSVFAARKQYFTLSVCVSAAVILYFAAINLAFTPHAVWAVYPAFGVLWWPLSVWLHTRKTNEEQG
jgi:hypothetical protein